MKEKFSDYEGTQFLNAAGVFVFKITGAELARSTKGTDMIKFEAKCSAGTTTLYHSLDPKARWSYNSLIKACLKAAPDEWDYYADHQSLVGKTFLGTVEEQTYDKENRVLNPQTGLFDVSTETKTSYKVVKYEMDLNDEGDLPF